MDFHSLTRRDLQSLCKRNKIPANKTNLAMADALIALEIVEGLEEYMNRSDSIVLQSPTSVAKPPPTRTTRRKTAVKAEPQPSSSQLLNRSCQYLDGEENVAEEPKTNNVKFEANVAKTPAARSTRKAPGATSCSSKVQESKKSELVQSAYSTRRSTRLLEKCMAGLSLKTNETLDKPDEIEETKQKISAQDKNPAGSEEIIENAEVISSRDLSASMEKEWEMLKHDSDQVTGDLGDIAVSDANTETNKEDNEVMSDGKEPENSLVQVNKQEETLQDDTSISEEGSKKNDKDHEVEDTEIYVDLGDIPVMEHANTETNNDRRESKNFQAFDSLVKVGYQETEEAIEENVSETEKTNTFDEEVVVDRTDDVSEAEEDNCGVDSDDTISEADSNQETEQTNQENDIVTEKINTFNEDTTVDQTDGDSAEPEGDTEIYVDLGYNSVLEHAKSEIINDNKESKNIQAFDSLVKVEYQETKEAIQENDSEPEKANTFDEEAEMDQTDGNSETELEEDDSRFDSEGTISESDSNQADDQETEHANPENDSETEKINTFDEEDTMVDQTDGDLEGDHSGFDSDISISEADSNQAVHGSDDIADAEMILSEPEGSITALTSPPLPLEEGVVITAPLSPFLVESISTQFPRPNKSASKNSAMKLVNVVTINKENNMEMMMMNVVNNSENRESKDEAKKKKKVKVEIDEENLKDVSMRQLVKLVKELSIKSSNNRTALQILPGNNQIAE